MKTKAGWASLTVGVLNLARHSSVVAREGAVASVSEATLMCQLLADNDGGLDNTDSGVVLDRGHGFHWNSAC